MISEITKKKIEVDRCTSRFFLSSQQYKPDEKGKEKSEKRVINIDWSVVR